MPKKSDDRARVWTAIVYPDSAPDNWKEIVSELHVPCCISPLHEFDLNANGTAKKPHWHLVLVFDGKKSEEQVKEMLSPLNCTIPLKVQSIRGMVRYLIHKDNPEKYQYDKSGIVSVSGFEWESYFEYADIQRKRALREMRTAIRTYCFTEYSDFCDFCDESHPEWADLLDSNCSYVISLYITSIRHKLEGDMRR